MTYDSFSKFYDAAMQDYSWCDHFLQTIIEEKVPTTDSVLELGCGTGRILEIISNTFNTSAGIDISEPMLEFAKKRLPSTDFYTMDMTTFSLPGQFNLIYSLYDSINHLLDYTDWERMFHQVHKHLTAEGIAIFDMNTPSRLARLSVFPPLIRELEGGHTMIMRVVADTIFDDGSETFYFDTRIFEHLENGLFALHREKITEFTPPVQRVVTTLNHIFSKVDIYDEDERLVCDALPLDEVKNGRLFFVCYA